MERKRKDKYSEIHNLYTLACHYNATITANSWYCFELKYWVSLLAQW